MDVNDNDVHEEEEMSSFQAQKKKAKGRGLAKAIRSKIPMYLEFDEFDLSTGEWEKDYGQQIGHCAKKLDINIHEWEKVSQVDKENMWEETKRKFHIQEDPEGRRKKNFIRAVGARFRHHRFWLVSCFIERTTAPPPNSPNASLQPWELYEGYITRDQWQLFESYVASNAFKKKSGVGKKNAEGN